ncbi:MAG: signal peptide peptidase SppA [Deltaproteobacteria bacterium]|nr:signal peptide peptidase SppA [Deltaproteobacteria bacterium]
MAKNNKRLLYWLFGFMILICVATVAGVILLMNSGPITLSNEASTIHFTLNTQTREAPGNEGLFTDPADLPPLSTELAQAIAVARDDSDVEGILLEIKGLAIGWAQAEELRGSLESFVSSGKPCTVWAEYYGNKEYYVASACSSIAMAPEGLPLVSGLNVSQTYFAGALEKLGVSANFEHVGDFKSAVEPYERTGPSEAAAAATNALLDSLYGTMIEVMATGRGISPEQMTALINDPPITGETALSRGLIDERVYRQALIDRLKDESDLTKGKEYVRGVRSSWDTSSNLVAVIYADGPIVSGNGGADIMGDTVIGSDSLNRLIRKVGKNDDVAAVVLRINSPGGSGMASDSIWNAINELKKKKPVVASMGDYAASGGYYIAMNADRIFAQPNTVTGSIGVFGGKMNLAGLFEKAGMTQYEFSRGDRSDLLSNTEDFDEDDRLLFRQFLETFYNTFVTKAAEGREMTFEEMHSVAQGRVWTGKQAVERGLVDELGSLDDAIKAAANLAEVSSWTVERLPERKGFMDQLLDELANPEQIRVELHVPGVTKGMNQSMRNLLVLESILEDGGVAAMLPGDLQID